MTRTLTALALFVALVAGGITGARAQPNGSSPLAVTALTHAQPTPSDGATDSERYVDREYGWSIAWDPADWEVPGPTGGLPAADLALARDGGASYVLFRAYDRYSDPASCLDDLPKFLASGFPSSTGRIDFEVIEDEDGDPISEDEDDRSYVAVSFAFGDTETAVGFDCRTLVEGEAVLLITHITKLRDFDDERSDVDELLEELELPAGSTGDDVETYESPQYGYVLEYDPALWTVSGEDDDPDDAYDRVQVEHELGFVTLVGDPDYAEGELGDCVADYRAGLEQGEGVDRVRKMRGESGEEDDRAWAAYTYELDTGEEEPLELVRFIECRAAADVTIVVLQTSLEEDYAELSAARDELLEGLETD